METVKEGNICVEVYQGELPSLEEVAHERMKAESQYEAELQDLQKKCRRYSELSLCGQVTMVKEKIKEIKAEAIKEIFDPKMWGYHEITPEEMRIWEVWLPTEYPDNQLCFYSFDQIPGTVLTSWEVTKALKVFQTFTIRTPEAKKAQDPLLIGWFLKMVNNKLKEIPYRVARWGESLRPFEEIKAIVEESFKVRKWRKILNVCGTFLIPIVTFSILMWLFPWDLPWYKAFTASIVAGPIGFLVLFYGLPDSQERFLIKQRLTGQK